MNSLHLSEQEKVDRLCDLLPQTQCRECGYTGCRPYAEALVHQHDADITKCLPGGQVVSNQIAQFMQIPFQTVTRESTSLTAALDISQCIGCNLCVKVCPVDAIIGELNYEHQVIQQDCTGCGLCVPVCPTTCLSLVPRSLPLPTQQNNKDGMSRKDARQQAQKSQRIADYQTVVSKIDSSHEDSNASNR